MGSFQNNIPLRFNSHYAAKRVRHVRCQILNSFRDSCVNYISNRGALWKSPRCLLKATVVHTSPHQLNNLPSNLPLWPALVPFALVVASGVIVGWRQREGGRSIRKYFFYLLYLLWHTLHSCFLWFWYVCSERGARLKCFHVRHVKITTSCLMVKSWKNLGSRHL